MNQLTTSEEQNFRNQIDFMDRGGKLPVNKFKQGDVVRYVQNVDDFEDKDQYVGSLFVISEAKQNRYSVVPIQNQRNPKIAWYSETELSLVLAVEDLVTIANKNRM